MEVGALETVVPLAPPQVQSTLDRLEEQEAEVQPLFQAQVREKIVQYCVTEEAVPALQRSEVGALETVVPLAPPQVQSTLERLAEQEAEVQPLDQSQVREKIVQFSVTEEAVPALQRSEVGALETVVPLAVPQVQLVVMVALHFAQVTRFAARQWYQHVLI